MADGGSALASMQRLVEERTQQASTAQQALMHLQQDHAHLTAHMRTLQDQAVSRLVCCLYLACCILHHVSCACTSSDASTCVHANKCFVSFPDERAQFSQMG